MSIFNNVEIYFSIVKYEWRTIRHEILPVSIQDLMKRMLLIESRKKVNIKRYWIQK